MQSVGHVYVMYDDNQALLPKKLAGAYLIRPVVTTYNEILKAPTRKSTEQISNTGWNGRWKTLNSSNFDTPASKMTATYKYEEDDKTTAEIRDLTFYSSNEMYIHVETSTKQGRLGENAVIHLRSNFGLQMNVTTVQVQDNSKETLQLVTRIPPGAFVGVSLFRTINYIFQADNTLTPSRVLEALYNLEPFTRSVHGVTWTDWEGLKTDQTEYFKGPNSGADTKRALDLAGILLFTDAKIRQYPDINNYDQSNGYEPCLAVGCFHKDHRCDGKTYY